MNVPSLDPIGIVHSPFREKFGIPRQSRLVEGVEATLELLPPYNRPEAVAGLETFSHLWLIFLFHAHLDAPWRPTVRPPRLGGNRRVGVFASRAPYRPNPLGLSAVTLSAVETNENGVRLQLGGVDMLDGTPVVDIKPYLPYADSIPEATGGFASTTPGTHAKVVFSNEALSELARLYPGKEKAIADLLIQLLALDPRPSYQEKHPQQRIFGMRFMDFDCRWVVEGDTTRVLSIVSCT